MYLSPSTWKCWNLCDRTFYPQKYLLSKLIPPPRPRTLRAVAVQAPTRLVSSLHFLEVQCGCLRRRFRAASKQTEKCLVPEIKFLLSLIKYFFKRIQSTSIFTARVNCFKQQYILSTVIWQFDNPWLCIHICVFTINLKPKNKTKLMLPFSLYRSNPHGLFGVLATKTEHFNILWSEICILYLTRQLLVSFLNGDRRTFIFLNMIYLNNDRTANCK